MFNKINHWWTQLKCKWAKRTLEQYSPRGEHLAFINDDEAKILKRLGGAGQLIEPTGVKSYFWPILLRMMAPRLMTTGLMGTMLAGSTMSAGARLGAGALGGLGSLAGGVVSGLGSVAGGLLGAAGSMLSGSRGGGGGAVAPSFGAQPFAGGAPLSLSAPGASRALVPSGGGGELDAAMGGALTAQQSQQDTMIGLLQQIAATVGVIAQNTAGLIGIQSAQLSGQQQAIEDQRTQLSLKGGETDDTTKETGPKPKWFANPLGKTGQKMLDFMKNPLPAAIGLFGLWWWLRNNMDVFEKVLVPILRFFKNLQEDPEGTWESLKETVKTFAVDSFNKIGHSMGNSVLDIFGFQFKDDKSWEIIAQPGEKWDWLNPFSGETVWFGLDEVLKDLWAGKVPGSGDPGKYFLPEWMRRQYDFKGWYDKWIGPAFMENEAFWGEDGIISKRLDSIKNSIKGLFPAWMTDDKKDLPDILKKLDEKLGLPTEDELVESLQNLGKKIVEFKDKLFAMIPSGEELKKMIPDIDWAGALASFGKFIYDKGPPEKFLSMDISVLKNALPSITDIKQAWNKFWPGTFLDFKDVRTAETGVYGGGSMIGAEAGVQERANKIADLKSELALELKKPPEGSGFWSDDQNPEKIAQLESELTRMGVPPIVNAADIGASTKTLQTLTTEEQMLKASGANEKTIVIDSSTKSSTSIANAITQAELSSQNEEYTARALLAYQGHIGFAKGLHGF